MRQSATDRQDAASPSPYAGKRQTSGEETANAVIHIVGSHLGAAMIALLVWQAVHSGVDMGWKISSGCIFGATVVLLYAISSAYHTVMYAPAKRVLQTLDHMAIYFLIAGSYTPFCLQTLRADGHAALGWTIFGIEWGLALCGVLIETLFPKIVKYASLPIYLVMGWLLVINIKEFLANIPMGGLVMLTIGGLLYTLGVIFYLMDYTPYMHTIWHVFVLGGIVCQWTCIMFWVIPTYGD